MVKEEEAGVGSFIEEGGSMEREEGGKVGVSGERLGRVLDGKRE